MIDDIVEESIVSGLKKKLDEKGQINPELFLDNV